MKDDELDRKIVDAVDSIPVPPDLTERLGAVRPARSRWRAAAPWGLAAAALLAVAAAVVMPRSKTRSPAAQEDEERLRALRALEKRILRSLEDPNLKEEFRLVRSTARFGNDAVPFLRGLLNRFLTAETSKGLSVHQALNITGTLQDIDTDESAAVLLDAMENPDLIFPQKYRYLGDALERMKSKKIGPRVVKHYRWTAKYLGEESDDARGLLRAVARQGGAEGVAIVRDAYRSGKGSLKVLGLCEDAACAELFARDYFAKRARDSSQPSGILFAELSLAARKELLKCVFEGKAEAAEVASGVWRDASPEIQAWVAEGLRTSSAQARNLLARGLYEACNTGHRFEQTAPLVVYLLDQVDALDAIHDHPDAFRAAEIRAAVAKAAADAPDEELRARATGVLEALDR